jgi:aspartyl-tRNA(Asn)/glutamyl-tRNA(Gln) amidotransferase subunit C
MKNFVNETKLKKLCKLAMLELNNSEVERYLYLMNNSLETLEALDDIDVNDIKELTNPYDMTLEQYPDIVSDGDKVEQLMECAPEKLYNYFIVPKVMEKK